MLGALDRGNLFLVPLDDHRQWYRYHRLFADVLNARLRSEQPDRLPELHGRASAWYERNGRLSDAVGHALAAQDFARAADLVELALPAVRQQRQEATALAWLQALPDPVLRCRPVLSVHYAGALLTTGQLEGVEERIRDAERWLEPTAGLSEAPTAPPDAMVVVDDAEFRALPSLAALYRAGRALVVGDIAATMTHARRALELAGSDAHLVRGGGAGLLGLAYWTSGQLEAGHRMYAECTARLERGGYIADTLGCAVALADIRLTQGRLRDAMRTYEQALRLASAQDGPVLRGTALAGTPGADGASLATTGDALVAIHNWAYLVGPGILSGVNALLLGSLMYRSGLVPRAIPRLGLIGAPVLIASSTATMFGAFGQFSTWAGIAAFPVAMWELSVGLWMAFKGFTLPPIALDIAAPATTEPELSVA